MLIDGKAIAEKIYTELRALPVPAKKLVAVLVGNAHDSIVFVAQKERVAKTLGVRFVRTALEENVSEHDLLALLKRLSNDKDIGGIIVQLPLPKQFDQEKVLAAIDYHKDVDALNTQEKRLNLESPTVEAFKRILEEIDFSFSEKNVVVVGKGRLVGKPVGDFLRGKVRELSLFSEEHFDFAVLKNSDLVIIGVGKCEVVTPEMLKPDAVVVDFGYAMKEGIPCGDFAQPSQGQALGIRYTPTPGGTGPVVVAQLFRNFYMMASKK